MTGDLVKQEQIRSTGDALNELDETLLQPLVLRYFCDLNSDEIGQAMNLSPSTVRTRLQQARLTLAGRLIEKGIEP